MPDLSRFPSRCKGPHDARKDPSRCRRRDDAPRRLTRAAPTRQAAELLLSLAPEASSPRPLPLPLHADHVVFWEGSRADASGHGWRGDHLPVSGARDTSTEISGVRRPRPLSGVYLDAFARNLCPVRSVIMLDESLSMDYLSLMDVVEISFLPALPTARRRVHADALAFSMNFRSGSCAFLGSPVSWEAMTDYSLVSLMDRFNHTVATNVAELPQGHKWQCRSCRYQFSVTNDHARFSPSASVVHRMCVSKKGVSAIQMPLSVSPTAPPGISVTASKAIGAWSTYGSSCRSAIISIRSFVFLPLLWVWLRS